MDNKDSAGLIVIFIEDKKFGFIKDKKLGEIFFHLNDFKSNLMEKPLINVAVKYKVEKREKGYCAKNVTVDIDNLYNNTPLTKNKGTISTLNLAQQTGVFFDKNNKRYLFNFNDIIGNTKVYRNQKVNFYPSLNNKGKDVGILVKLIDEKQEPIRIDNSKLHAVISDWKVEARASVDELKYFYYMNELDLIKNHDKCYVIGRKGTGKTAMAEFIHAHNDENVFTTRISLKNYPFINKILEGYTEKSLPNDFVNVWKFIIFSAVLKMMSDSEQVDGKLRNTLKKIYPDDSINSLERIMNPKIDSDIEFELMSYIKFSIKKKHKENSGQETSYFEKSEIYERNIAEHYDGSTYVIIVDGLDDEYNNVKDKEGYYVVLAGLFKAVQEIKFNFQRPTYNLSPVIFLRDDLYRLISQADKTKWNDFRVSINWSQKKIQDMIAHRISKSLNHNTVLNFNQAWDTLFPEKSVLTESGFEDLFTYIQHRTFSRPRDYIQFIKICCERAIQQNKLFIDQKLVSECLGKFSNSIRGEIENEIFPEMNCIHEALNCIRLIGKSKFNLNKYREKFNYLQETGKIPKEATAEKCLDTLFEFNLIGNISDRGKVIFISQNSSTPFSPFEDILLHKSLRASLGVE
jgi:cold shock CspA family protein